MGNYSGYLLSSGNGANSVFTALPITVQPGASFQSMPDIVPNILLAGGFPTTHPNTQFPLSPTLQLNGDRTDIDNIAMTALAKAEYIRHSSQSYRSYTLESDSRLTVIGASASALHTFIDTYGGVLQITPLLIQGYDPSLTTAWDIEVNQLQSDLQVSFTVKQPINLSRCSYCGACGSACPEHCISEQLFLDFSLCSFCNDCVTACSLDAIDLHAAERQESATSAILLLDETQLDLPEQKHTIYSEATLPALFESISATEVEEIIDWNGAFCQYSPRLGTGCTACFSACRYNAIQQNREGIQIDHLACVECGACLSSCPSGALQYQRFDDRSFIEYFRTFPLTPGSTVIFGNEKSLHTYWWQQKSAHGNVFFMEHPTPAALHAMHFLLLYAMGAKCILVSAHAKSEITLQMQLANSLIHTLFRQEHAVQLAPDTALWNTFQETPGNTPLSRFYHDFSYSNRREKLLDLIQFFCLQSDSGAATIRNASTKYFGEIICNLDRCTHCMACVNECRMEALLADSSSFSLKHTPARCVQCTICVTVCPENALSMQSGIMLAAPFFQERNIAQAEPVRCKECGKIFGTRKSLEKVIAILVSRQLWNSDDDLLSYCESCRVVKLYESGAK